MRSIKNSHQTPSISKLVSDFCRLGSSVVLGKENQFKLCLIALIAKGHVLIEDSPGSGKTTFAKVFAKLIGLSMKRVQFTNDLLPSDILGTMIFDSSTNKFKFESGPIFCNLFLGDELNRASPRTQSACLQAMEEFTVAIDGNDLFLPDPFMFLATQNPHESAGVFKLPESQLDRFMLKISLGEVDRKIETTLLMSEDRNQLLEKVYPVLSIDLLQNMRSECNTAVTVSEKVAQYLSDIVNEVRLEGGEVSMRAMLSVMRCAKAQAYLDDRSFVTPDDIKSILLSSLGHRVRSDKLSKSEIFSVLSSAMSKTKIPL